MILTYPKEKEEAHRYDEPFRVVAKQSKGGCFFVDRQGSHHSSISTIGGKYIRRSNLFNLTLRLLCSHRACPSYTLYEINYVRIFSFQCVWNLFCSKFFLLL
jgi:hypothetical protein